ncbi:hypothetical protein B0T10DRAFT_561932 [Thelonectria olida]|uniref:Uncharacterized protein n=1 Tax=Thelonectria olida TaxID=1576542 RepID=A0A9P9APX3_9HYPO|nr:hypothetical protein B0T10DRAFT_561932 [Thelonectria olida]
MAPVQTVLYPYDGAQLNHHVLAQISWRFCPSQNGKTTFINRIIKLAVNKVPFGEEGQGNFKCTTKCRVFDLEIPITDYFLRDKDSGRKYDVPGIADEEKILKDAWWRKQTAAKYAIEPCRQDSPTLKIRLIDTPSLDNSDGKDFENMSDLLATLNQLAKPPTPSERRVHAVVLVYNAESSFSYSFQSIIKDYHSCMPNLFDRLSVVDTHFSVAVLAAKRQHLLRDNLLGSGERARASVLRARGEDFSKIIGDCLSPTHFFIDNKPKERLAYDALLSFNTIFDIASFWATAKPTPISQMRLIKTPAMQAVDKRLQLYLQAPSEAWIAELKTARSRADDRDAYRDTVKQRKEELDNAISRTQSDLGLIDNDQEYYINTYMTRNDMDTIDLARRWATSPKFRNTLRITEAEYPEFGLQKIEASLAETQAQWDECRARADGDSTENVLMDKLALQIEALEEVSELLEQATPPVDQAYSKASRLRYKKAAWDVGHEELFDLVGEVKPGLLRPLQRFLG